MDSSLPRLDRALVVDDNSFVRQTLKAMLRRIGPVQVDDAADGGTALAMVTSARPDLVICDVCMSPIDGFVFLAKLRQLADAERRATRVIMLTADISRETADKAKILKPDGYLVKPTTPTQLSALLRGMFRLSPPA